MSYTKTLAQKIGEVDFSKRSATLIGFGNMGKQHLKALHILGVTDITVCSRSEAPLKELFGVNGITIVAGGHQNFKRKAKPGELGIVATDTQYLLDVAKHLVELGFKTLLIEKPISLWSKEIADFDRMVSEKNIDIFCAYNRAAYPGVYEVKNRVRQEGGITSCIYHFTEFVNRMHEGDYSDIEMERWGIANSLHVMSLAHALIGQPKEWKSFQTGNAVKWHPAGSVFVGAGISDKGIPFSYHADWGSTGRWLVEVHTPISSYRFCPLEKLLRRIDPMGNWEEIPLTSFASEIKTGFVEQIAAILDTTLREKISLVSLEKDVPLTLFAESVFNYRRKE